MKYYKDIKGMVWGYDETDSTQAEFIQTAIIDGWTDVTGSWPPPGAPKPILDNGIETPPLPTYD